MAFIGIGQNINRTHHVYHYMSMLAYRPPNCAPQCVALSTSELKRVSEQGGGFAEWTFLLCGRCVLGSCSTQRRPFCLAPSPHPPTPQKHTPYTEPTLRSEITMRFHS